MVSAATDSRPRLGGDTLRPDIKANEFDRVLTVFGILAGHLGSFAVLYFWLTGAILLFTGNGGQLVEIVDLNSVERMLYLAYPVVVLVSFIAWLFFALKRDLVAIGVAGLPVVCAVLYFFYLNTVRW